jgi:hypothetical protein
MDSYHPPSIGVIAILALKRACREIVDFYWNFEAPTQLLLVGPFEVPYFISYLEPLLSYHVDSFQLDPQTWRRGLSATPAQRKSDSALWKSSLFGVVVLCVINFYN